MTTAAAVAGESRQFLLARSLVMVAVAVAMVGSSLPSPLYGLYQARLHLDHVWLTAIYGQYSVGTVFALFVLGRISDRIGDRRLLLYAALAATSLGAVIMALGHRRAGEPERLVIARFGKRVGFRLGRHGRDSARACARSYSSARAMAAAIWPVSRSINPE